MLTRFILPAVILTMSLQASALSRMKCAPSSSTVAEGTTLADYDVFLVTNKIYPKTDISLNFLEQFRNEFEKFPLGLHKEMLTAGAKIHIMEGEGVTVDPTWRADHVETFDGRKWSEVPGAGGSTAKEYAKAPTRIVINHLYDKQGSASMFLHEYAHNLDSINSYHGISNSQVWKDVLDSEPNAMNFLTVVCGAYCSNNVEEGFAELLANYYGCEETRTQLETEVPKIAEFFKRFKSTKNLKGTVEESADGHSYVDPGLNEPSPEVEEPRSQRPRLGCRTVFGREVCI